MCSTSSVDVYYLSGDVRSIIEEEAHAAGDIPRLTGTLKQRVSHDLRSGFVTERVVLGPEDWTWRHSVHPYLGCKFNSERSRQPQ